MHLLCSAIKMCDFRGLKLSEWAAAPASRQHLALTSAHLLPPASPPPQLYRPNQLEGQMNKQMKSSFNSNQFTYVFSAVLTNSCVNTSGGVTQGQEQTDRDEAV